MSKVHLRSNKLTETNRAIALCASTSRNGKIIANKRTTYRFMASEIVGKEEYFNRPINDRCAHCEAAIPAHNAKRIALGLKSYFEA